eukprot:479579-Ditylum_brightwellii.AAC.3
MDEDTYYNCTSAHYNLISATDKKIEQSPLTWGWRHVKGHQDDDLIGPLDLFATLNIDMDLLAKQYREQVSSSTLERYLGTVEGEPWPCYRVQQQHENLAMEATT